MATYIGKIEVGGSELPVASTLYGTCDTAASTTAKVVTCANFDKLITGVTIHVYFKYTNSASSPTMNVNSTGAKTIYKSYVSSTNNSKLTEMSAGYTYSFTYNGTGWVVNDYQSGTSVSPTTDTVGSASGWSAGTVPTLGTAIPADDITAWDAGSAPTLGTDIDADDITAWDPGSAATLGTAIDADDITAWSAGTMFSASASQGVLTMSAGTAPSLSYTARSIPNVTNAGTAPSLSYTPKTIPNVTSVGSAPSLSYTAKSIPNVTSVGTAPSLTITEKTVVTDVS